MDVHVSKTLDREELEQALMRGCDPVQSLEWINDDLREELISASKLNANLLEDIIPPVDWDKRLHQWSIPVQYQELDIKQHVLSLCRNDQDREIALYELREFESRSQLEVLKSVKYLVDTMQKQGVLYGVGRGSSVSSLVLFLLGAHRIDPVKWNLDPSEFFK